MKHAVQPRAVMHRSRVGAFCGAVASEVGTRLALARHDGERRREPSGEELLVLQSLSGAMRQQYNPELHQRDFQTIHDAFFPDQEFVAVGTVWKAIGFQSPDPVKDLRGAGTLGLSQLAYFVTRHPAKATAMHARISARRDRDGAAYPFAAAGINITRAVCELFEIVAKHGAPGAFADSQRCFWPLLRSES
eukprot:COSAG05_NODE_5817_length_1080_cov_3.547074_1_plen_190_part_01